MEMNSRSILSESEVYDRFGQPEPDKYSDKSKFYPPFQMHLAWGRKQPINYFFVHKEILKQTERAFDNILHCYSDEGIKQLGIDEFGGCYNYRLMRGSSSKLSRHSWAIAIDLHPDMNKLSWKEDKALFATEDYKDLIECFYDAGFVNYGREKGKDYMHFEIYKTK